MTITFDSATHTYRDENGVRLPSVTEIIKGAGLMEGEQFFTEEARDRGTAVHAACHYLDEGDLDTAWMQRNPQLAGYVEGWIKFKERMAFVPDLIEHRVHNATYGYAGSLDRTGRLGSMTTPILLDIKTGIPAAWHDLQSSAYASCFGRPRAFRRMTVYLHDDGTFGIGERNYKHFSDDWNTFLSALQIFTWKEKNVRSSTDNRTPSAA